jgi:hypothetical protein
VCAHVPGAHDDAEKLPPRLFLLIPTVVVMASILQHICFPRALSIRCLTITLLIILASLAGALRGLELYFGQVG